MSNVRQTVTHTLSTAAQKRLLPPGTRRRQIAKRLLRPGDSRDAGYQRWIRACEPALINPRTRHRYSPLISVVVPVFNTPDRYLMPMVQSVIAQSYPQWELCIADGSDEDDRRRSVETLGRLDPRIKIRRLEENRGIAGNTNAALSMADGDFVAFLDHDDTLAPFALNEVTAVLNGHPDVDLIYSDEDKLSTDGRFRFDPLFKPDWSPDLLTHVNYVNHLTVVRSSLIDRIGGLRHGYHGAQDLDLWLRLLGEAPTIHHIPLVLYHWRVAPGSTARAVDEKENPSVAGVKALTRHLERHEIDATVDVSPSMPTTYRLTHKATQKPVYVNFMGGPASGSDRIEELVARTDYAGPITLFSSLEAMPDDGLVLNLHQACHPLDRDWLNQLVAVSSRADTGLVGGWVVSEEGRSLAHGYVLQDGRATPIFVDHDVARWTDFGMATWPRNFVALAHACLMVQKSTLLKVSSILPEDWIDAGVRLHEQGLLNVFWPHVKLRAQGAIEPAGNAKTYQCIDPYFNPNLAVVEGTPIVRSRCPQAAARTDDERDGKDGQAR